jgi:hypothetical protein
MIATRFCREFRIVQRGRERVESRSASPGVQRKVWATAILVRVKGIEPQLKKLAARAKGILGGVDVGDLAALYRVTGLPATNVMTNRDPAMVFYDRIAKVLVWPDPKTAVQLDDVERHLVLRWLADDAPGPRKAPLRDTRH